MTKTMLLIIGVAVLIATAVTFLGAFLGWQDGESCAARGLRSINFPSNSMRKVCLDADDRLIWPESRR